MLNIKNAKAKSKLDFDKALEEFINSGGNIEYEVRDIAQERVRRPVRLTGSYVNNSYIYRVGNN